MRNIFGFLSKKQAPNAEASASAKGTGPRIFVSHSHKDDAFTTRLVADLRASGVQVWVDTAIRDGNFVRGISDALDQCEWFVLVLTPNAIASKWVREETDTALDLVKKGRIRAVIPVQASKCNERTIPSFWAVLHRYDAVRNYQQALTGLKSALRIVPIQPDPTPAPAPIPTLGENLYVPQPLQSIKSTEGGGIPFDTAQTRRLPVYLLLASGRSMAGLKLLQVNSGVQLLYQELMADPRSANTVWMSVIPFATTAYQVDLVPISEFIPPTLTAGGRSSLGAALGLLNRSLDTDVRPVSTDQKGDYKPIVFIMTDTPPTDAWLQEASRLAARTYNKPQNIVALAIGQDVDVEMLRQITPNVLRMDSVTADTLRNFFQTVSDVIMTASQFAARSGGAGVQEPPLPNGIVFEV